MAYSSCRSDYRFEMYRAKFSTGCGIGEGLLGLFSPLFSHDAYYKVFWVLHVRKHFTWSTLYFFLRFHLLIFRHSRREGAREGEKHQCVVASPAPPTGDLACNPGMCSDWKINPLVLGPALNPLSHTSQASCILLNPVFMLIIIKVSVLHIFSLLGEELSLYYTVFSFRLTCYRRMT